VSDHYKLPRWRKRPFQGLSIGPACNQAVGGEQTNVKYRFKI
jgi:hypothetical protein